jgi:hypothetical protein
MFTMCISSFNPFKVVSIFFCFGGTGV